MTRVPVEFDVLGCLLAIEALLQGARCAVVASSKGRPEAETSAP